MDLDKFLRQAVEKSGLSHYRICQETGIDQGALSRFMASKRGLRADTAGILLEYLGFEIKPKRKSR